MQTTGSVCLNVILGPVNLVKLLAAALNVSAAAFIHLAHVAFQAAVSCWQAVRAGSSFAPVVAGSAKEVGSQASLQLEGEFNNSCGCGLEGWSRL
jgi:hypothetical protein